MFTKKFTKQEIEQKRKRRKFSVPYNNRDPDEYLERVIDPYIDNIDNIYFEVPNIVLHNHNNTALKGTVSEFFQLQRNTYNLTAAIRSNPKYKDIKMYVTYNSATYFDKSQSDKCIYVGNYFGELVNNFKVDGIICADLELAEVVHQIFPDIEIQTSCNTYQWLPRTMKLWHDAVGTTTFNPPREILRDELMLRQVASTGYKLKCIVNEACIYGCPQNINHAHYIAYGKCNHAAYCDRQQWRLSDLFKTNFILPRQLKYYDDYVDIFKISGRGFTTNMIATMLDSYVNERNDVHLGQLITSRKNKMLLNAKEKYNFTIPVKMIPDKLLSCRCEQCDDGCEVCDKVVEKLLKMHSVTEQQILDLREIE